MNFIGLHFGCGGGRIAGWQNLDIGECDVTKLPLRFDSNSADRCMASHLLEHLSGPQALGFLDEVHRVLKPGGAMRLCCPVIGPWLSKEHARDLTFGHGHMLVLNEHSMRDLLWMAGFAQDKILRVDFDERVDHHFLAIGRELDALETLRLEATKS